MFSFNAINHSLYIFYFSKTYLSCFNLCGVIKAGCSLNHIPLPSLSQEQEDVNVEDEMEDCFSDKEEDLGAVEEERSVILHLLSQLKLGMDLTRVG